MVSLPYSLTGALRSTRCVLRYLHQLRWIAVRMSRQPKLPKSLQITNPAFVLTLLLFQLCLLICRKLFVEIQVEFEHIDPRLTQEAKLSSFGMLRDQGP
jgi:hypothetical protein